MPRMENTASGLAVTHSVYFKMVMAVSPAAPGEVLSLFATGLGPTRPAANSGQPFPPSLVAVVASDLEVRVNAKLAEALGAMGISGTVGGYQINFRVPAEAIKGTHTVQLNVGIATDNSARLEVR